MRKILVGCFASAAMIVAPKFLLAADPPTAAATSATAKTVDGAPPAAADVAATATSHGELFDRLDANHNGQLEPGEIPADKQRLFQRLLRRADKGRDGTLSRAEFVAGLAQHRPERALEQPETADASPPGVPDVAGIFARLDANKDGKITPDEVPAEARERFQLLLSRGDKDNDGVLTREEATALIESFKTPQADDPAVMFKYLDTDGDGKIALSEVPAERREGFEKMLGHFDKDGDGKLNEPEFTAGMKFVQAMRAGQKPSAASPGGKGDSTAGKLGKRPLAKLLAGGLDPDKLTQRLMQLDKDQDGKISRTEAGPLAERFDKFDANQDGFVDEAEIRARLDLLKKERAAK